MAQRQSPYHQERVALALRMLQEDGQVTSYRISQACLTQFGCGIGYNHVESLRAQLAQPQTQEGVPQAAPRSVAPLALKPSGISEVRIPPEMLEDPEPALAPASLTLPAVVPNGTTTSFQNIQAWMQQNQAEQVILNKDGRCSVLAWHHFNVGGPANG